MALFLHLTCTYQIYMYRSTKRYFIIGLGTGTGGMLSFSAPPTLHFFCKSYTFVFVVKISDKSSPPPSLFASDASVHYNPELTPGPEWFVVKNTLNKRFYINFIFLFYVFSYTYVNISHLYLLHCSIYFYVRKSVHNLYLDLKYIDIA